MHNGRLADPLDPATKALKAISSKRKKTDEDLELMRKLEWFGSLYQGPAGEIGIPADNILALVVAGAKKNKLGKDAASSVREARPFFALKYEGPKAPLALYETPGFCDVRGVRVTTSRVMRARPRFATWSLPVELVIEADVIDVGNVLTALKIAGQVVGLGDYRPRFGRFEVKK
jgi:hypothetical protein